MHDEKQRIAAARHCGSGGRRNQRLDQRCVGTFRDAQYDAVWFLLPPRVLWIVVAVLFGVRVLTMMINLRVFMSGAGNLLEEMMHPVGR